MRLIRQSDLGDLAVGAAVLGTGGGGRAHLGMLIAEAAIERHGPVTLLDADEVPDDALVASLVMIGAPTVVIEKIPSGDEAERALAGLEQALGRPVTHVYPAEAGGVNSIVPFPVAASRGLPVVDADGMGRAYPELQMITATLFGMRATPLVIVDAGGDVVTIPGARDNVRAERLARAVTVEMGCTAIMAVYPMSGAELKRTLIHGTITRAQEIGAALRTARAGGGDPVDAVRAVLDGVRLFDGKVVDVNRRTAGGFNRGEMVLTADGRGEDFRVRFQNENLAAIDGGRIVATVPDLIIVLDSDTGAPVMTEDLRYGLRVSVIGAPCDPLWRSPAGLALGGPRYFGYDVDFVPVERLEAVST